VDFKHFQIRRNSDTQSTMTTAIMKFVPDCLRPGDCHHCPIDFYTTVPC